MSAPNIYKKKNILMTSISARGHAAPMMALSAELARRGHKVTYVVPKCMDWFESGSSLWESDAHELVDIIHPFDTETFADGALSMANITAMQLRWSHEDNFLNVMEDIGKTLSCFYVPIYEVLDHLLMTTEDRYDLVISDYVTLAGWDVATRNNVPLILNWPGMKNPFHSASFASFLLLDFEVPMSNPLLRFLNHFLFHFVMYAMDAIGTPYGSIRKEAMAPMTPVHPMVMNQRHPILYNTVIGVSELAQAHTPLEYHVGVLLPKVTNHDGKDQTLSPALAAWIEDQEESRPLAVVNFGTTGMITAWKFQAVLDALAAIPDQSRPSVLWRMSAEQEAALGITQQVMPPYIHLVRWIEPNQQALLCHPRVSLFVTHGGLNSPQEAIDCGKPLIVVPAFADQAAHGARLAASGVAITMGAGKWSSQTFQRAVEDVLSDDGAFRQRAERASELLRSAGGTARAADIVETILKHGYEHLLPGDTGLPFWQRVLVADVVLGYTVAFLLFAWMIRRMVRFIHNGVTTLRSKKSKVSVYDKDK